MKNIIDDINNNSSSLINGKPYKFNFKINLGGDSHSGKTTFMDRIISKSYKEDISSTISGSFFTIRRKINKNIIEFDLWDSVGWAGSRDSLAKLFLKGTKGILLLFALNVRNSFLSLERCFDMINEVNINLQKVPILLLGTHQDLFEKRDTESEEALVFSKNHNFVGYFEISSKTGKNVEEVFNFMAKCIYQIHYLNKKVNDIKFEIRL